MSSRRKTPTPSSSILPVEQSSETSAVPNLPKRRFFSLSGSTTARIVFFLFFLWFWGVRYADFLYMSQEYDLFIWRSSFAADSAIRVAGLSRYLSAFVVQFFYYPLLGATILASFLVYIQFATERLFKIRGVGLALSFVPSALLAIQIPGANYYLFEYFDVAYLFSFIFQFAFVLTFLLLFDAIRSSLARTTFFVVGVLTTYPIFGFFALFAAVLALLRKTTKADFSPFSFRRRALFALVVVATPLLYWPLYANSTPTLNDAYLAGLLEETVLRKDVATTTFFQYSLAATIGFFVVAALVDRFRREPKTKKEASPPAAKKSNGPATIVVLTLLVVAISVVRFSFYEINFTVLLKIARALDRNDWDVILREESQVVAPINPLITARYLALTRTNRIADAAFERTVYPVRTEALETIQTFGMCGDRMLYEYGALNLAARSATNNYVMKRDRSVWAIKTLALSSIAADRRTLAERYLFLLQGTLFHRAEAENWAAYLEQTSAEPSRFASYLKSTQGAEADRIVAQLAPRFAAVRDQGPFDDRFSPSNCADYIRYFYVQNDDISRRSLAEQENRLAILLVMRDLPTFAKYFDAYLEAKGSEPLPRCLCEAALFRVKFPQSFLEKPGWRVPQTANISAQTRAQFDDFIRTIDASRPRDQIFFDIETKFGDTFWAHAFAANQVKNY